MKMSSNIPGFLTPLLLGNVLRTACRGGMFVILSVSLVGPLARSCAFSNYGSPASVFLPDWSLLIPAGWLLFPSQAMTRPFGVIK